jgi:hypothetical protein
MPTVKKPVLLPLKLTVHRIFTSFSKPRMKVNLASTAIEELSYLLCLGDF